MPKYNQILLDKCNDTTSILRQIVKQYQKYDHAWNHINDRLKKRGIISAISNILFGQIKVSV